MKKSAFLCLVDYYNLPRIPRGRDMSYRDHEDVINYILNTLDRVLQTLDDRSPVLLVRLYGGWYDRDSNRTEDGNYLSAQIKKHFPTVFNKVRYNLELACGPLGSDYVLPGTLRVETGLPSFSMPRSITQCQCSPCHIESLRSWKNGKCPNHMSCNVSTENIAYSKVQKLVDTLIVADAIISTLLDYKASFIISNDDDIIPGILYPRIKDKVSIIRPDRKSDSIYNYLREEGFNFIDT